MFVLQYIKADNKFAIIIIVQKIINYKAATSEMDLIG